MSSVRRTLAVIIVAWLVPISAARADVAGPDDSIGQAFGPLVAGMSYSGAFKSATDVDYLALDVTAAGQALHFDVTNTVRGCGFPNFAGCPVYATLIDGQGQQLGGEGSAAGTGPVTTDSSSDVIDWTFAAPGRYYVAMDSDGDLPTYSLRYRVLDAGNASVDSARPPIISLRVLRQRGAVVRARMNVGRALSAAVVWLQDAGRRAVAVKSLGAVGAGKRTVKLRLDARTRRALARRGRLTLRLRVAAAPVTGTTQTVRRIVHLARR